MLIAQDDWSGPLGKTKLKQEIRVFCGKLNSAATLNEVGSLEDEYASVLTQCKLDMPDWYMSKDDRKGIHQQIEETTHRLEFI